MKSRDRLVRDGGNVTDVGPDPGDDQDEVRADEHQEDRHDRLDRLLDAAHVHDDQREQDQDLARDLEVDVAAHRIRHEVEQRVATGGDRDRDGEDVVDQQRATGDHARLTSEQLGGDHIPAAAVRKVLDHAAVRVRDDEHGHRRRDREKHRQIPLAFHLAGDRVAHDQVLERLGRTVGRRRQSVRAEADPGEKRDQRDLVKDGRILNVALGAEQDAPEAALDRGRGRGRGWRFGGRRRCGGIHAAPRGEIAWPLKQARHQPATQEVIEAAHARALHYARSNIKLDAYCTTRAAFP